MATPIQRANQSQASGFDPSVINDLNSIMSKTELRELLEDMVCDATERLQRIGEATLASGGLRQVQHDAHDLKSMGGNFGLTALSHCAGQVERAARDGNTAAVRETIPTLLSLGRTSLDQLVSYGDLRPGIRR